MSDSSPHNSPRPRSKTPPKRISLFLRGLSEEIKDTDLREFFSKFGEIRDVYIPKDYYTRKPRGFGFVEFLNYNEAKEALEKTDGTEVLGTTVKVVFAREERKAPDDMRRRERRYRRSRSPRRRSRSRTPPRYRRDRSYSSSR
ncbi:SCL25A [Blepharisma stoltei]|uniref:RRM domain-containing protein n=1 Tax=Blepharisma stoltei TaxID=1481888 RepID=A0AAU9IYL6_9CILI|nr:unnamed protein product [Blepharisma stoltei]